MDMGDLRFVSLDRLVRLIPELLQVTFSRVAATNQDPGQANFAHLEVLRGFDTSVIAVGASRVLEVFRERDRRQSEHPQDPLQGDAAGEGATSERADSGNVDGAERRFDWR